MSQGPLTEQEALDELRAAFRRMSPEQLAAERTMLKGDIGRSRGRDPYMDSQLSALDQEIAGREGGSTASDLGSFPSAGHAAGPSGSADREGSGSVPPPWPGSGCMGTRAGRDGTRVREAGQARAMR